MRPGGKKRGYVSVLRKRPGRTAMELATTPMTADKQVKRHPIVQEMQESIQAFRAIGAEIEPDLGLSRLKRAARSWQRQHFGARRQMTKTEATTESASRSRSEINDPRAEIVDPRNRGAAARSRRGWRGRLDSRAATSTAFGVNPPPPNIPAAIAPAGVMMR